MCCAIAETADGGFPFGDDVRPLPSRGLRRLAGGVVSAPRGAETAYGGSLPPMLVTVHPPVVPSPDAVELVEMLLAGRTDVVYVQTAPQPQEPMRLF